MSNSGLEWLFICFVIVVLAYVVVRVGSYAYFRTKLEYFRTVQREAEKSGEENGETKV